MTGTSNIIELAIGDAQVRITPDKCVSVFDIMKAAGVRDVRKVWERLKVSHPEVVAKCHNLQFPGSGQRPTPTADKHAFTEVMMVLPGKKAATFRTQSADIIVRYLEADETLTADLIDRTEDNEVLERLALRAKTKVSAKSLAGVAAERGMNRSRDFAKLHDSNNVFVTGKTAKELQLERQTNVTRDSFASIELATLDLLQLTQTQHIEASKAQGAGQVLDRQEDVRSVLRPFRDQFLGKKSRPSAKDGTEPMLTVDV